MIWLLFGCSEQKLSVFNSAPDIQITSPAEGETFFPGDNILVEGVVSDANDSENELEVEWSWEYGEDLCLDSTPSSAGEIECGLVMPEQSAEVIIRVRDPIGAVDETTVLLELAEEKIPHAEIFSPLSSQTHYVDRLVSFSALLSDEDSDVRTLLAYWESSLDGVLDLDTTVDSEGKISDYSYLSQGEHAISLWVEDVRGNRTKEVSVIDVGPPNSVPECGIVSEEGSSIFGEAILFSGVASDLDIPAHRLDVRWKSSIDGLLDTSHPSSNGEILFSVSQLSVGQHIITLEVEDEVGELCSDTVVHHRLSNNSLPIIDSVQITPFPAKSNSLLSCVPTTTDADGDSLTISYSWKNLSTGVSLGNNNALQLSASTVVPGQQIECSVTVDDGQGGTDQSTGVTTIENSLPQISGLSMSPSSPEVGDIASCLVQASDIDNDVLSVAYSWENVGTGVLLGTNDSLLLAEGSVARNDIVRCTVTLSDLYGGVVSDMVQDTIANSLPIISSVSISPTAVYADTDVEAIVVASDADGDAITLQYTWRVNSNVVQQNTTSILDASWYTRGDVLSVSVLPSDPIGAGAVQSYGPFTIQNTPPTAPVVYIDPQEPITEFDDLQCVINVDSEDADGDAVSYSLVWKKNGVLYTGPKMATILSGDTIPLTSTLGNEDWTCSVLPNDGIDNGSAGTDTVTVIPCADYRDTHSSFSYGTLVDSRDGKSYRTIEIGSSVWMADNLNYGSMITTGNYASNNGGVEKHCLDNNPALCNEFGGFYGRDEAINWVDYTTAEGVQGICPSGWHVATESEFLDLFDQVSAQYELVDVCEPGGMGADLVGFAAKLSGSQGWGAFSGTTTTAKFWTSTYSHSDYSFHVVLQNNGNLVGNAIQTGANPWANTMSIRCVQD